MSSILDPFACGFVKVGVYNILTEKSELKKQENQGKTYVKESKINTKIDTQFKINYKIFTDKFPKIIEHVRSIRKRHPETNEEIL